MPALAAVLHSVITPVVIVLMMVLALLLIGFYDRHHVAFRRYVKERRGRTNGR